MEANKLKKLVKEHEFWLKSDGQNLTDALNLSLEDLRNADFRNANLSYVSFVDTDLRSADFTNAFLYMANLSNADIRGADFTNAFLYMANLSDTDIKDADFTNAYVFETALHGVNMEEAKSLPSLCFACPETGSFIGYKAGIIECQVDCLRRDGTFEPDHSKVPVIVVLEIPADAKRSSATTRKCRCNKAKVVRFENMDGDVLDIKYAKLTYPCLSDVTENGKVSPTYCAYSIGEEIFIPNFDTDRWNEDGVGIQFFYEREAAKTYIYKYL